MTLKILSVDLALTNAGFALVSIPKGKTDVSASDVVVLETELVETSRDNSKTIRRNSDDLRRLRDIARKLQEMTAKCDIVFAEIPSGAQNARAALTFGAVLGMIAGISKPVIEVQKDQRGYVVANRKIVTKSEVIDWATKAFPDAGWKFRKFKGEMMPVDKNEHVADALANVVAGTRTEQFRELTQILASISG